VFLGVLFLGEHFTARTAVATTVIVAGVALIVSRPHAQHPVADAGAPEALTVEPAASEPVESRG
jgi:hypothetical protein